MSLRMSDGAKVPCVMIKICFCREWAWLRDRIGEVISRQRYTLFISPSVRASLCILSCLCTAQTRGWFRATEDITISDFYSIIRAERSRNWFACVPYRAGDDCSLTPQIISPWLFTSSHGGFPPFCLHQTYTRNDRVACPSGFMTKSPACVYQSPAKLLRRAWVGAGMGVGAGVGDTSSPCSLRRAGA